MSGVSRTQAGHIDVAFLGDSITQGWEGAGRAPWNETFAPLRSANFGIGGDSTQHVLWRLDNGELIQADPKVVVLLIGTNNCPDANQTPEMIAEGIEAIVGRILSKTHAKILLHAIFPRDAEPTSPQRIKIGMVNEHIAKLGDDNRVFYRDFGQVFLHSDGTLRIIMMPDKLHLSEAGYRLWTLNIKDDVAALLARR